MAVAIYARKSTESEERQVQSLDDQLFVLRSLAEREGYLVSQEIIESKSAKEPGTRPEFARMVREIESGSIDGLMVWQMNRLSRNMVDGGVIAHMLQTGKLKFIRTAERTYLPSDSALILAIENGAATDFIQTLSRNVKRGLAGKAQRGWLPGQAPFGYVNNRLTKEIEPDPLRFPILKQAWNRFIQGGCTIADVYREAVGLGLTSKRGHRPANPSTFYAMFSNRFYMGEFEFQGEIHKGKHLPMVTAAEFERAQELLPGAATALKQRDPEQKHPYAGVFTCPVCGCQITAETKIKTYKTTGNTVKYTYYRCTGARGCPKNAVRSELIDGAMKLVADFCGRKKSMHGWGFAEMIRSTAEAENMNITDPALTDKVSKLKQRLGRLRELRMNEELSSDEYLEEKTVALKEIAETNKSIDKQARLGELVDASIIRKNEALEEIQGWDTTATIARRRLIQAISEKCFLTLEMLQIWLDPVIHKIIAIEPPEIGSGSANYDDLAVLNFNWYRELQSIRLLEGTIRTGMFYEYTVLEVNFETMKLSVHQQQFPPEAPVRDTSLHLGHRDSTSANTGSLSLP